MEQDTLVDTVTHLEKRFKSDFKAISKSGSYGEVLCDFACQELAKREVGLWDFSYG